MRVVWATTLASCLLVANVATSWAADRASAAEAARLKKEGDEFMDSSRYAEAAQTYAKAYALSKDPALLYNEGRALEALGEYPEAVERLEAFRATASPALRARASGLDQHIEELKGRVATLAVTSNVSGAHLVVRSKLVGTLEPSLEVAVRAGPATIEVTAEGYVPFQKEIDLPARTTTRLDVQLEQKRPFGMLVIRTRPSGSDVLVDGALVGRSPLETRVDPGAHVVTVSRAGHADERREVTVANGERQELEVTLRERSNAITSRWWFWAGVGVVVAGAAVTSIVLLGGGDTTEPARGDFSPGQIPASIRF